MNTLRLTTDGDLSQAMFEDAAKLLCSQRVTLTNKSGGVSEVCNEQPLLLICSDENLPQDLVDWLWDNSRVTTICCVSKDVLKSPYAWAVQGYKTAVVCGSF